MRLKFRASITLILCLMAGDAGAQFLQYTPPGGPERQPESRKEELERRIDLAPYRVGPFRVAPWASLRDVSYVRNFFATGEQPPNDVTATVGAGFRAYLRNGGKAAWTLQVLPEYVWWSEQSQRRQLNGRYLLGYAGYFNRLTVEARAGREQRQRLVTPEVPVPVSSRVDVGELLTEVELTRIFRLFATTSFNRQNNLISEGGDPRTEGLRLLDRDERVTRAGLRWTPRRQWTVALGAERSEVDFERDTLDRSNAGTAPIAEVRFQGRRVGVQGDVAARSLEARQGAQFVPFDKVTGNAALLLGDPIGLSSTLYASRNLVYSLAPSYAYLTDDRFGASLSAHFGQRIQARVFGELGTDDYTAYLPGAPKRQDDLSSYGVGLTMGLRGGLTMTVQGLRTRFDSNLPGGDRTYTALGATIDLLGLQ